MLSKNLRKNRVDRVRGLMTRTYALRSLLDPERCVGEGIEVDDGVQETVGGVKERTR